MRVSARVRVCMRLRERVCRVDACVHLSVCVCVCVWVGVCVCVCVCAQTNVVYDRFVRRAVEYIDTTMQIAAGRIFAKVCMQINVWDKRRKQKRNCN